MNRKLVFNLLVLFLVTGCGLLSTPTAQPVSTVTTNPWDTEFIAVTGTWPIATANPHYLVGVLPQMNRNVEWNGQPAFVVALAFQKIDPAAPGLPTLLFGADTSIVLTNGHQYFVSYAWETGCWPKWAQTDLLWMDLTLSSRCLGGPFVEDVNGVVLVFPVSTGDAGWQIAGIHFYLLDRSILYFASVP